MKGILRFNEAWIVLNCENDYLDLPSLTKIQCKGNCSFIHQNIGYIQLESVFWFYFDSDNGKINN